MTTRKPIVLVGNATSDLASGDDVGDVSYSQAQSLTAAQKAQAATNGGFVANGSGVGQVATNQIKIGWTGGRLKATVDTTDLGQLWNDSQGGASLSGSGYQKLPSGLIVQWVSPVASGDAAVTLPVTFPNAILGAVASISYDPTGTEAYVTTASQLSTSNVTIRGRHITGGSVSALPGSIQFYVFAWGY